MMNNPLTTPNQPVSELSIADLEIIIADVVRRVLREEMRPAVAVPANGESLPEAFAATFGAWEDSRPVEAIVTEIYESRTVSTSELSL